MTKKHRYTVACLAGDGIGPEVMAEASRAVAAVARLHGFEVEEVHAPFGGEAFARSGHPLPASTRTAYLEADAVLVASARESALEGVESELDLSTAITRVRFGERGVISLLSPLADEAQEWTIERAFDLACARRGRVTSVYADRRWRGLVEEAADGHPGLIVEHLSLAAALPQIAFEPDRFDVVLTERHFAEALASVAGSTHSRALVAASGRLSEAGPGIFGPTHGAAPEIAGQGVANPSSMLLAAALMLGEGLGERGAAETLEGAVAGAFRNGVRTPDMASAGVAATTREFMDVVLAELPGAVTNAEFYREAIA